MIIRYTSITVSLWNYTVSKEDSSKKRTNRIAINLKDTYMIFIQSCLFSYNFLFSKDLRLCIGYLVFTCILSCFFMSTIIECD